MKHSRTIVSDLLNDIFVCNLEIVETILIGEKIEMIHEAGNLYNHLMELTTADYFSDGEVEWMARVAKSWNREVQEYHLAKENDMK